MNNIRISRMALIRHANMSALVVAGIALLSSTASAQRDRAAQWRAWTGCWAPVMADSSVAKDQRLCITSNRNDSSLVLTTIVQGVATVRVEVDANKERRQDSREGCTGWERAEASASAARVYLRAEHVCDGGIERHVTGLLSLTAAELLDVRRVAAAGSPSLIRVVHYRPVSNLAGIPAEITSRVATDRAMSVEASRLAATRELTATDVIEAARLVDAPVVQAWLVERGRPVPVDAKSLTALADAHVADGVIDVIVALAYPERFQIDPTNGGGARSVGRATFGGAPYPMMDDPTRTQGYGLWGRSELEQWDREFYNRLYTGSRYGNGRYGYDAYGYYPGVSPIEVNQRGQGGVSTGSTARVVNGQGYTQGRSTGTSSSLPTNSNLAPRPQSGASNSGSSSTSGGGSSSGSSSSGSSGASSASGAAAAGGDVRLAKPKPPGGG